MSTIVSITLYAISVFIGCMMGLGAGKADKPVDEKTANTAIALFIALILFFGLATALQVAS